MNLLATVVGMAARPTEAMESVVERPRSWLLAAALVILGSAILIAVSAPYQVELANERSEQMIESIAASMPEEQAQMVRDAASEMTVQRYWLTAGLAFLVVAALGWVARGAIVHFSSVALGGHSEWGATFAIGVWAMVPYCVRELLQTAYVAINGQIPHHAGLAFFVSSGDWIADSRNMLYALASNVDPFALWHIVLLGIGISVATKVDRAKGMLMAIVIFCVFLGLKLIPVAIGAAVGGRFMG